MGLAAAKESAGENRAPGVNRRRTAFLPATCGILVAAVWIWHQACGNEDIRFLPRDEPGQWIICDKPLDGSGQRAAELRAVFRRSFSLSRLPAHATVRLRAFQRSVLRVNGQVVKVPPAKSWKQASVTELTAELRPGENHIEVTVINEAGPPALWFVLEHNATRLVSDESWEAAYSGAVWRAARLASRPLSVGNGNPLASGETALSAWRTSWPHLLVLAVLVAVAIAAARWLATWLEKTAKETRPVAATLLRIVFVGTAALWASLLLHNAGLLRRVSGFDAQSHLDYTQYVLDRRALPLAHEGASMYNPPLYYLVSALTLAAFSSSTNSLAGVVLLRLMSIGFGLLHLVLIFRCLRLLFPGRERPQAVGLLLAAWLPMNVYLAHYTSNETLLALLTTAVLYLCLRLLRDRSVSPLRCAALGLCLGAALLTKFTALLLLPFVFGALAWRLWEDGRREPAVWLRTLGVAGGVCLLVCGWHFARVWAHFGKPLVGAWDPVAGDAWWQDEGYRTGAWFGRCGRALTEPLFSSAHGFADGIYSTMWADGLCGGVTALAYRPPWNYDLMLLGSWLSLGPALLMVAGAGLALWRFLREPSPEWLLLNGLAWSFAFAFTHMALEVPCLGQIKAFYGLLTLLPLGVFGALGWEALVARRRLVRAGGLLLLGVWCLNNFATYWIQGWSADAHASRGRGLLGDGQAAPAAGQLSQALQQAPDHAQARAWLAEAWLRLGRAREALVLMEQAVREHPEVADYHLGLASALEAHGQLERALEHTRRAAQLEPDQLAAWWTLARRFGQGGHSAEAVRAYREALRIAPNRPDLLSGLVWVLATGAPTERRAENEAVELAGQACRMMRHSSAQALLVLGVAEAQAGWFSEAIASATRAADLARATGDKQTAALVDDLLRSWRASRAQPAPEARQDRPRQPVR